MVRLPGMPAPQRDVIARDTETVTIRCPQCMVCNQRGEVTMPKRAWQEYDDGKGAYIQTAWPEGSAGEREMLINGTHPKCFDELFPPEED